MICLLLYTSSKNSSHPPPCCLHFTWSSLRMDSGQGSYQITHSEPRQGKTEERMEGEEVAASEQQCVPHFVPRLLCLVPPLILPPCPLSRSEQNEKLCPPLSWSLNLARTHTHIYTHTQTTLAVPHFFFPCTFVQAKTSCFWLISMHSCINVTNKDFVH